MTHDRPEKGTVQVVPHDARGGRRTGQSNVVTEYAMPYAANDGVQVRYEVEGHGSPLVLHPGFIGSLEDWVDAGYVTALRDRYRLVMRDPRAYPALGGNA